MIVHLKDGVLGAIMAIHTFGDYSQIWHPHLHAIVADGLFTKSGVFCVMPKADLKPLAEVFRANVPKMLKKEGKITDGLMNNLMEWRH